jgi:predicted nucleic acid-binding protein
LRVLFDTSTLVAAMVEDHPQHDRCLPWLQRARKGEVEFLVAAHSLAELFAVLSSWPSRPRLSPSIAARLVRENVSAIARVVTLSAGDYEAVVRDVAEKGLAGGVVCDALIARAAHKAGADRLLTLNPRHFLRVWPEAGRVVASP